MDNDKRLVVKDNALIDASFSLSLIEQRLMLLAIVEAREINNLSSSTPIKVTVKSYIEQYKADENSAYKQIQDAANNLFDRQFSYYDKNKDKRYKERWIYKASYMDDKGYIEIFFTPDVISMISRLEVEFTKYLLNQVSDFKSKYSIRLYEIIIKWATKGQTERYKLDDLRDMLGLESNEYRMMSDFKLHVLDKAVKEINKTEKIQFTLKYDQFKAGRIITHIQFKMKMKPIKKNDREDQNTVDMFADMTDKQINMFGDKLSKDRTFQSYYIAKEGDSTQQYAIDIKNKLLDPFYVREWMVHLERVGYVPSVKKGA